MKGTESMINRKIKILGIAPYQSLKTYMEKVAQSYSDIELVTYVGDLEAGVKLSQQYMNDGFDIIISRGGTASLIKNFSTIPVIEIPLSFYDILRTLKLTSISDNECAIIGFENITKPAGVLCDMLGYKIKSITIHDARQAEAALYTLKSDGYKFVLCDVITETIARETGLNPVLITSGIESIQDAFDEAVKVCLFSESITEKYSILEEALQGQPSSTVILNENGDVIFSTYDSENISEMMSYLHEMVKDSKKFKDTKEFHMIENNLYSITVNKTFYQNSAIFLFYIEPNPIPSGSSKYGLRYTDCTNMMNMYTNSFYSLTSSAKKMDKQISMLTNSNVPIMILGEKGTGKNQVAAKLYIDSTKNTNPYIIIDCPLINEKNWNFLTKHYNSPLFDKGNTIFISNIQALSDLKQQQLLSVIIDTNVHKRNRLIFSCSQTLNSQTSNPSLRFINYLTCATIFLPPLRELTSDIPSSASLYLNALNVELARQVSGFEPHALDLLRSYNWPENFEQLKRVLAELVLLSTNQLITTEITHEILEKEKRQYVNSIRFNDDFDYNRPLNEMIQDIVKIVLDKCDGNQTRAAKQLGIGRTTLWRYLNTPGSS